jgi:hypothetical protein
MRGAVHFLAAALVAISAFWAYRVNYQAQEAQSRVAALHAQIAREREAISVLRAELAWLTAPDRIGALVAKHAGELGLAPMRGAAYASVDDIPRRPLPTPDPESDPEGSPPALLMGSAAP